MHLFFTPSVISAGAVAGFLVGSIWYTVLFGRAYMYGVGMTKETLPKRSVRYMVQIMLYSFIAHIGIASTIAVVLDLLAIETLSVALYMTLFLTFGFIVTTKFMDLIYTVHGAHYEKRPQVNFLVHTGYYLCMTLVMTLAMWFV
jgi:hypothetical protein